MAVFQWDAQTTCGDTPPEICDALDTLTAAQALRVTDPDSKCEKELISDEYPSFPTLLGDTSVQPRSGSSLHPLPMDLVQTYEGNTVPEIFFRNDAGQMASWNPPLACDNKKVVVESGAFTLKDDINSNVFSESCIGDIEDIGYIAGGALFNDCNGVQRLKLVFVPKDQICDYCS